MEKKALTAALKSVLLFLILFIGLDRTVGYILSKIYFNQTQGDFYQTTYAVKQSKDDVLIFGSSRAMHHYVSKNFENKFNLNTYNVGRNGKNILYSYALLSQIITRHNPKIIILDVQPREFSWKAGVEGEDEMISSLLPYTDEPAILNQIVKIRKSDIVLSKLFCTYPYNSNVAQIFGYYYGLIRDGKSVDGYIPLHGNKIKKINLDTDKKEMVTEKDPTLVETFTDFLKLAKERNIKVYVIASPTTVKYQHLYSLKDLETITKNHGFKFYNFSNLKEFSDFRLFYDGTHLNDTGARKFSKFVLDSVFKNE